MELLELARGLNSQASGCRCSGSIYKLALRRHRLGERSRPGRPSPEHRVYPYLLRCLAISRVNQVWAADITYIPMGRGFLYLVAIIDWYPPEEGLCAGLAGLQHPGRRFLR